MQFTFHYNPKDDTRKSIAVFVKGTSDQVDGEMLDKVLSKLNDLYIDIPEAPPGSVAEAAERGFKS